MKLSDIIKQLKNSTVAIGIAQTGKQKIERILGSGFFINSEGYVLTATHVVEACRLVQSEYKKNNIQTEIVVVKTEFNANNFSIQIIRIVNISILHYLKKVDPGPDDLDIACIVPIKKFKSPSIGIKNIRPKNLYDRIIMSGYPAGEISFSSNNKTGLRFSPLVQFGRISSFLPFDDFPSPWGIQTDIIATGGSSGSAIVDLSDGKVIGIAQNVIPSGIMGLFTGHLSGSLNKFRGYLQGNAKIGMVYGLTTQYFQNAEKMIKEKIKRKVSTVNYTFETFTLEPISL